MKIIIINATINWVYRLYEEYIISIKDFIKNHYNNVFIEIKYIDSSLFTYNNLTEIDFKIYDKIFYSGNIEILNLIIYKFNNNYKNIYFINIEQMSNESYYTMTRNVNNNVNIIDYSEENIPYFKNIYNNVYLIPPYFKYNEDKKDKTIDVLSILNNEYRGTILNNLVFKEDLNILFLNNCYGSIRDEHFANSKIYINIHCSENHKTMEMIRLINLIFNKVIIISQKSICSDILFMKKYIIICNENDEINTYTNEILNNYKYYYDKIYGNFNSSEYYNYIKLNVDKIFS